MYISPRHYKILIRHQKKLLVIAENIFSTDFSKFHGNTVFLKFVVLLSSMFMMASSNTCFTIDWLM